MERWTSFHILAMGSSYYWTLPALVGVPLATHAVRRHTHLTNDLVAALQAPRSGIGGYL